jgi:3'-phosphoadenosine 5'-phosphosulfate sulfotransferase (PAPS reductase)/FAD synthetase
MHVVLYSGGVSSWAAAKRVADLQGTDDLTLLFTDTMSEDEDTYRFLRESAAEVGGELIEIADGRNIWEVFRDSRVLGNSRIDPCSRILKRELARKWINENCAPLESVVYLGISWDEEHRYLRAKRHWQPYTLLAPLCERPFVTKRGQIQMAEDAGLPIPRLYKMGFPHANCGGGCVKAGAAHFRHLLKEMPDRFAEWERNEESMREFLDRDVSILKDRAGGDARPMTLRELRERVERDEIDEQLQLDWGGCGCMLDDAA